MKDSAADMQPARRRRHRADRGAFGARDRPGRAATTRRRLRFGVWKVLELATKRAEEEGEAKTRLAESIAAAEQRREFRRAGPRPTRAARRWWPKQKLEREWRAEGVRQVKQQGLDRWLKPR